jgi:hypothetical protein
VGGLLTVVLSRFAALSLSDVLRTELETLYSNELTRLCAREDYIESCRRESFKTYMSVVFVGPLCIRGCVYFWKARTVLFFLTYRYFNSCFVLNWIAAFNVSWLDPLIFS